MSEMSASVVLSLVDNVTKPARQAHKSLSDLVKDMERFGKMSFKANGLTKQVQAIERSTQQATKSVQKLRQSLSRPTGAGFSRSTAGFTTVTNAANKASQAVQRLQQRMKAGGAFTNRGGFGGPGGSGGGGKGGHGAGPGFGGRHGLGIGQALKHVGVYEAVHRGIDGTVHAIKSGFEQVFEAEHTKTMLAIQGESQQLIDQAVEQSHKMAKSLPSFTSAQHLEAISELRPALLGGLKEAIDLAPLFQKSIGILEAAKQGAGKKALGGTDTHGEALSLVRALEVKNVTGLGDKAMESYVDNITKAIVAFNGQIKAEDFHSAFKFSRGDSVNWSEEFATQILPTLMNELKKSSKTDASMTGNALKSMSRAVVDNVMTPKAAAAWDALGMYSPDAFQRKKDGSKDFAKLKTGEHMAGYQLFQQNPYQFVQDYLLPHMKEHGIDLGNREQVVASLGGLFGNRVANHIAQILATQQAIIQKDAENVRKAMGMSAQNFMQSHDPTTAMHMLSASMKELGASAAEIATPAVMRLMKGTMDWAHAATEKLRNSASAKAFGHDLEAMVAGFFKQGKFSLDPAFYADGEKIRKALGEIGGALSKFAREIAKAENIHGAVDAITGLVHELVAGYNLVNQVTKAPVDLATKAGEAYKATQSKMPMPGASTLEPRPDGVPAPWYSRAWHGFLDNLVPAAHADQLPAHMRSPKNPYGNLSGSPFGKPGAGVTGAGINIPTSLESDGIAAKMAALMASLQAIAAQGIRIPVSADTSGIAGAIQGALAAGKGGPATIHVGGIHVNGAKDPKATASEVHSAFNDAVSKHLADIG